MAECDKVRNGYENRAGVVATADLGTPLTATRAGFRVYRVGNYRLICDS